MAKNPMRTKWMKILNVQNGVGLKEKDKERKLNVSVTVPTQYEIDKALVSLALEHALLDFGKDVFDKATKRLYEGNFIISDYFDHPEYLSKILNEQFGTSYTKIIDSMQVWLADSSSNQLISDFLRNARLAKL